MEKVLKTGLTMKFCSGAKGYVQQRGAKILAFGHWYGVDKY
jgi:hypothetical protein